MMELSKNIETNLYLNDAMDYYGKKFEKGKLNLLNAPAGSGKTTFIFNGLINNTSKYANKTPQLNYMLNKIIYVCDTTMLKDSVLKENSHITKILGEGTIKDMTSPTSLKNIMNGDNGRIIVITYQTLGWLLKQPICRDIILDNCQCLILDEIHNLYKYAKRFNTTITEEGKTFTDGNYIEVIDSLQVIIKKVLTIGISATIDSVKLFYKIFGDVNIPKNTIFTYQEIKSIREYNFNPEYTNCIMNKIKLYNCLNVFNKHKTLIYTNTISKSKKLKEWFTKRGIKAEWLCSINNKVEIETVDNETGEIILEKVPLMSEEQIELRKYLLDNQKLPSDIQVLIINGSYETGWNLKDDDIEIVIVDNSDEETQIQVRNRVRHDIKCLITTCRYDEYGYVLELRQYANYCEWDRKEDYIGNSTYRSVVLSDSTIRKIDERFLRTKLTKEMKEELLDLYAMKHIGKDISFKTYLKDLESVGYVIKKDRSGVFIYTKDDIIKTKPTRSENKMNKLDKYLNDLIGVRLDKKGQEKLIKTINLKKPNGTLQDKIGKLNEYIRSLELGYVILSKSSGNIRYWIVEFTEEI